MKFKVGDRVKCINAINGNGCVIDKVGTIIKIPDVCFTKYSVEFDKDICGHTCGLRGKNYHCWYCDESDLVKVVCSEKIVITSDGKTTTAKLYDGKSVVKSAMTKCSPKDEFDFVTGAKIAFDRLIEKKTEPEEKPLLNTRFCVVEGDDLFKTGHIYEVIDGKILNPHDGGKYPVGNCLHSNQELYDYFVPLTRRGFKKGWSIAGIKMIEVVDD